ncbi:MAG: ABC transporter ATP-binding protein, partial [Actinomycetota bacterium]
MLAVEGVRVAIDGRTVLDGVDLAVPDGETVAVLGPSGCGKTTLLRVVAGLRTPTAGRVMWAGEDLAPVPVHRRGFGLVFQEYALFWERDVRGNVEFGLRMARVSTAERRTRVDAILARVGLADRADQPVVTLSGGEQQRVALARTLVTDPRLLMLDEPLGALDREWRVRLLDDLRGLLAERRLPALVVTHDHAEAFALADTVAVMRAGRVVQTAAPAELWRRPADAGVAGFLGFGPAVGVTVSGGVAGTPWGRVPAPAGISGRATAVPRPDAFRIDPAGPLTAIVERCELVGARAVVTFRPEGSPPVRCETAI